jgi:hypothetical protein
MKEPPKKFSLLVFFALISLLFKVLVFDHGANLTIGEACLQDMAGIELVVQTDSPDKLLVYSDASFGNIGKSAPSFGLQKISNVRISLPRFVKCLEIHGAVNRCPDSSAKHIITILQKMNHWHQSSDDDPSHLLSA